MSEKEPLDYPRALSLPKALEILENLNELGGKVSRGLLADSLGVKPTSGPFRTKLSSLTKYGFIIQQDDNIEMSKLARNIYNAYNEQERLQFLTVSFMRIPLFKDLYDRFKNLKLNIDILEKILIREYYVNPRHAQRLKNDFINSAKYLNILNDDGTFNIIQQKSDQQKEILVDKEEINNLKRSNQELIEHINDSRVSQKVKTELKGYSSDIFDLIKYTSSYLTPDENTPEIIAEIIEKHQTLTHLNLALKILKKSFESNDISQENINILLEALRQDLKC